MSEVGAESGGEAHPALSREPSTELNVKTLRSGAEPKANA